jgi:ribonuclease T1
MAALRLFLTLLLAGLLGLVSSAWAEDISRSNLPPQARETLRLIDQGGPFPHKRDGITFGNYEKRLPLKTRGYYREYTVPTPGEHSRGARRIIAGTQGERYYTPDHYRSFQRIRD